MTASNCGIQTWMKWLGCPLCYIALFTSCTPRCLALDGLVSRWYCFIVPSLPSSCVFTIYWVWVHHLLSVGLLSSPIRLWQLFTFGTVMFCMHSTIVFFVDQWFGDCVMCQSSGNVNFGWQCFVLPLYIIWGDKNSPTADPQKQVWSCVYMTIL